MTVEIVADAVRRWQVMSEGAPGPLDPIRLPRRSLGEGGKIPLAASPKAFASGPDAPETFGLESMRNTGGFAEIYQEVARRRTLMKRRVEALRDKLGLAAEWLHRNG
jgi:hypothetical protein